MSPLDAVWHLAGFAAVPILFGLVSAGLARGVWRRRLAGRPFWPLALRTAGVALATAVLGLVMTGRDGSMPTYAAMVLACAAFLWWPLRGR